MVNTPTAARSARNTSETLAQLPLITVKPSPLNPRQTFAEEPLQELAASIREHGILEPIVVRPAASGTYELIAGERRWRAAQLAELVTVPAIIRENVDDTTALQLMLVENLQRQDLDPIEEAAAYKQLEASGLRQTQIAEAVRRSRPAVANRLRLLDLPADVQERIKTGELSPAHGIALAKYAPYPQLASAIAAIAAKEKLTAHQLEEKQPPNAYALADQGIIGDLGNYRAGSHFDRATCEKCPHRRKFNGYSDYCFDTVCYTRKKREGQAAAIAAVQAATSTGIPQLSDIQNYRIIYNEIEGCQPDCPKRKKAQDRQQDIVEICTDPECRSQLDETNRKAKDKARKNRMREKVTQLNAIFASKDLPSARDLALLAFCALSHSRGPYKEPLAAALARYNMPELNDLPWSDYTKPLGRFAEAFERLGEYDTIKLIVELLLTNEAAAGLNSEYTPTPMTDWYIGEETLDQTLARCGKPLVEILAPQA